MQSPCVNRQHQLLIIISCKFYIRPQQAVLLCLCIPHATLVEMKAVEKPLTKIVTAILAADQPAVACLQTYSKVDMVVSLFSFWCFPSFFALVAILKHCCFVFGLALDMAFWWQCSGGRWSGMALCFETCRKWLKERQEQTREKTKQREISKRGNVLAGGGLPTTTTKKSTRTTAAVHCICLRVQDKVKLFTCDQFFHMKLIDLKPIS